MSANAVSNNTFSYYTSAVAATADALHKSGAFMDIISKSTPTLDRLRQKGKITFQGGKQVAINLMYGLDTPVDSYSDLDSLTITRSDGMTEVFAPWAQYHFPVVISGHEARTNKGKAEVANLLKARFRQGMLAANERLSNDLWDVSGLAATSQAVTAMGNGGKNIISIPAIVGPYADGGSTGGMDTSDSRKYSLYGMSYALAYWHAQMQNAGGTLIYQTYIAGLRNLFLNCAKQGGGEPDVFVGDYTAYANYLNSLDTKIQYTSWKEADIGFKGVECMGAMFYPDRHVPDMDNCQNWDDTPVDSSVFALNTEHLGLAILSGADFIPSKPKEPENQDVMVVNHFFEGQMICDHRSAQGLMHDIPASIAAS